MIYQNKLLEVQSETRNEIQLFDNNFWISLVLLKLAFLAGLLFKDVIFDKLGDNTIYSETYPKVYHQDSGNHRSSSVSNVFKKPRNIPELPSVSVVKSSNTYRDIPLTQKYDFDDLDYFYEDYDYHLYPEYDSRPEETRARLVSGAPVDQFIFPSRYVISQPQLSSTKWEINNTVKKEEEEEDVCPFQSSI